MGFIRPSGRLLPYCSLRVFSCGWNVGPAFEDWKNPTAKNMKVVLRNTGEGKKIFEENLKWIMEHNAKDGLQHELGLGPFADLTSEEFLRSKPTVKSGRR